MSGFRGQSGGQRAVRRDRHRQGSARDCGDSRPTVRLGAHCPTPPNGEAAQAGMSGAGAGATPWGLEPGWDGGHAHRRGRGSSGTRGCTHGPAWQPGPAVPGSPWPAAGHSNRASRLQGRPPASGAGAARDECLASHRREGRPLPARPRAPWWGPHRAEGTLPVGPAGSCLPMDGGHSRAQSP